MQKDNEKVICPCCGAIVGKGKFCPECGSKLEGAKQAKATDNTNKKTDFVPLSSPLDVPNTPEPLPGKAVSDEGLTLLVNTCQKTIATVGGDGYSEIVLYLDEKTGQYWLHTYSKYVYMKEEAHASYVTTKELADKVFDYIEKNNLVSWKDNKGFPVCGGDYIIRFKNGDEMIRLDSGKMQNNLKAYNEINGMLYSDAVEENRRYQETK